MEKMFKTGYRVKYRITNQWGTIRGICRNCNPPILDVELDGGKEIQTCPDSLVLFDDKKTAFLTEMKELLTKYNVEIDAYGTDYGDFGVGFKIGDDIIWYSNDWLDQTEFPFPITPSNIFDYDK